MEIGRRAEKIASIYSRLQKEICQNLEQADGNAEFTEERWEKEIGYGITCAIRNGDAIERGGQFFVCKW